MQFGETESSPGQLLQDPSEKGEPLEVQPEISLKSSVYL